MPPKDAWTHHVATLHALGIPEPGTTQPRRRPATLADEQAFQGVAPSFTDLLPWVAYLPDTKCMLLDNGQPVAAFFELTPIGTEGREPAWLLQVRDTQENVLQDSFDELDHSPWIVQLYVQDNPVVTFSWSRTR